ncbi:hypothetical protein GCM10022259_06540 [Aquimarina mytili]
MNNAIAPITTPAAAIPVMMFIALLLPGENKYRLAMYNEKFKSLFCDKDNRNWLYPKLF